ncbi:MAG: ABC transporter permease [Candidatus Brockarchaeota archaeon]|nr:ABC transporter permease [Candidatus Brockarchaeota archaeon]
MKNKPRVILLFFLVVLSFTEPHLLLNPLIPQRGRLVTAASASPEASMHIRVLNALTGQPVQNATIVIWDLRTLKKPEKDAGIYFTNSDGECDIPEGYLKLYRTYWLYAYKGDLKGRVDFAPTKKEIFFEKPGKLDITLLLVPGATVKLEGSPYLVQAASPGEGYMVVKILVKKESFDIPFIREYGDAIDVFYLGLDRKTVIVPAGVPFDLEVTISIALLVKWSLREISEVFYISNGTFPFLMPQGSSTSVRIPQYSLERGLKYVESRLLEASSMLDKAQDIGFMVFEERNVIGRANQKLREASALLPLAKTDDDFDKIWLTLREVLGEINLVTRVVQDKYSVGKTHAVYLSAVVAVFSVVLSFFFLENEKKKTILFFILYILILCSLYFINPGTHIIIHENFPLFIASAVVSFTGVSAIVFGIPRVWKERTVEGEVSWRSALSIIFSMSKRQIRRKKIRGFFTIFSICMLVLAFTAFTTFGTAFGIVSLRVNATPSSEGVLVRRMINGSSLIFSPLGVDDATTLSKIVHASNIALRMKNIPKYGPVARLTNPTTGDSYPIFGVIAVSPEKETLYTKLNNIVEGNYLSGEKYGEALVSLSLSSRLGLKIGSNATLEILGTAISKNIVINGFISDEKYEELTDVDGNLFGPACLLQDGSPRRCNASEILIINLKTAEKIQEEINKFYGRNAPRFLVPVEIVFRLDEEDVETAVKNIISFFNYDVFISSKGVVNYYYIGSYIRFDGTAELLIPLLIVVLSVGMVMANSVYERGREIKTLLTLGLNPTHVGLMFLAEAIVLGMVGGSVGYLAGLGFYRALVLLGQSLVENLMVREKLEWWWSALGFSLAVVVSIISAIRPTGMAIRAYTPSMIKKVKRPAEEKKERREKIFKVYRAREISMPVKIFLNEKEFFIGFLLDYLKQLRGGRMERVDDIEDLPETEDSVSGLTKKINFKYYFRTRGQERGTKNSLVMTKAPSEEYYRIRLVSEPVSPGLPEMVIDRTVDFVHWILMQWVKDKKRIMGVS